jgi:hypothetical protein
MNLNRRYFLAAAATAFLPLEFANAASDRYEERLQRIKDNVKKAQGLRNRLLNIGGGPDMNNETAARIMTDERQLRLELFEILRDATEQERLKYVTMPDVAKAMIEYSLPLLPRREEITVTLVKAMPPERCEQVIAVVADIIIKATEMEEVAAAMKEVLVNTPQLREALDKMAKAIELRDWNQAIDLVNAILKICAQIGTGDVLVKILGPEEINRLRQLLLRKLGIRFVPFVGHAYTVITIGTACFNNVPRIVAAIKC